MARRGGGEVRSRATDRSGQFHYLKHLTIERALAPAKCGYRILVADLRIHLSTAYRRHRRQLAFLNSDRPVKFYYRNSAEPEEAMEPLNLVPGRKHPSTREF